MPIQGRYNIPFFDIATLKRSVLSESEMYYELCQRATEQETNTPLDPPSRQTECTMSFHSYIFYSNKNRSMGANTSSLAGIYSFLSRQIIVGKYGMILHT